VARLVRLLQDMKGHAVLDAAGEVHVFGLRVNHSFGSAKAKIEFDCDRANFCRSEKKIGSFLEALLEFSL